MEAEGASGGLALIWDPKIVRLDINSSSPRLFSFRYKFFETSEQDYLTNSYGPSTLSTKGDFLDAIALQGETF